MKIMILYDTISKWTWVFIFYDKTTPQIFP